jgi:hypothetical protein
MVGLVAGNIRHRRPEGKHSWGSTTSREGAMSDLLHDARDLRQKLYRLEVLLEVEKGGRRRAWLTRGDDQDRAAALRRLVKAGLIEAADTSGYRVTSEGREFLNDVRAKVGRQGQLDGTRADEIDFA